MNCGALPGAGIPNMPAFASFLVMPMYSSRLLAATPWPTASTCSNPAILPMGAKSFTGSYFTDGMVSGKVDIMWLLATSSMVPSLGADRKVCAAICPPAPGRFSTTTESCRASRSLSA
ncbi:hypothetical protein D3C71_1616170 [compost metagenome]